MGYEFTALPARYLVRCLLDISSDYSRQIITIPPGTLCRLSLVVSMWRSSCVVCV